MCWEAGSTGERDKLGKALGWSIPPQGLAGTFVEQGGDVVELLLAVGPKVDALGEELADQAVPLLVLSSLPGAGRVAEVDRDARGHREAAVRGHLAALVPGQRPSQVLGQRRDALGDAFGHMGGTLVLEL